ncbi:MAG: hypothetical protein IJR49_04390, partial [Treponema sp.]|nr:hypothetical protein [Treponema sp.]
VEEYSTKSYSDSDGKLNSSYSYELEKIIKDKNDFEVLKSLAKDANSSVIETTTGFSIFHVTEEATKPDFSNESTIRDVYNYLNTYEVGHIEDYYTKQANEFVTRASVDGFENACSQFNIQNNVLSSFPLNYGSASIANSIDTSIQGLSGCDSNEHFLQTAFSLKQDEISSPIVNDKSIIVLQMRSESLNDATEDVSFANEISAYDSSSVSSSIKESPKVENNVLQVFIKYFLNNE